MMADDLVRDSGGLESSNCVELVDDSALTAFSSAPKSSEVKHVKGFGVFMLSVVHVPETGQQIHMEVWTSPLADQSVWISESDMNEDDMDAKVYKFKQATNSKPLEVGPLYGPAEWLKVTYGYSGGTGAGASLKVYLMGRV